ncbi:amidohydrolase family protein [Engelhardtia mirabilis]|uniref:Imidazolonepropionase n=1 Tax=Engelhardtia mirabilis TaxID=2528011 RepID=A0A518BNH9_9BACT|nr:imidazolonepropionase [Planctomycetes bacterium Pla133]QDV02863.1 imidazolonepropionase [Planctomycetes bacterium Pla86]
MNHVITNRRGLGAMALAVATLAATAGATSNEGGGRIAIKAGLIHTAAGEPIRDGVILIDEGRITAIGPAALLTVPDGWTVREAAVATPGLVDAHTCVGLAGFLNTDRVNDELDRSESVQPELRALDAYNLDDPLIEWVRSFGVTTVHTGHAPGALVSGQSMVAKTTGSSVEEAVMVPAAMVTASLSDAGRGGAGNPGTRSKSAAVLRAKLYEGLEYSKKLAGEEAPPRNLRSEALAQVVTGELPLLVTAHTSQDIVTALRIAAEFPHLRLVLDGAAEAPRVIDEILAAGVPVIVHPTMQRSGGEAEELSMGTARRLVEAGVTVALQTGYEGYVPRARVLLFEAAVAARYGLDRERALALVTIEAAKLCGVGDRVGSLEVGKDGDVALFDGDPFEYTSHCVGTVIEGRVASEHELWTVR